MEYENMPEPKSLLTLSWEDIVNQAAEDNTDMTREQVIEVFDKLDACDSEPIMDAFWHMIQYAIDDIVSGKAKT